MRRLRFGVLAAVCLLAIRGGAFAAEPDSIPPAQFDSLKAMIQSREGENRFWQVSWHLSMWEARRRAAAEGKPIFVWSGSEGAPITAC